MLERLGIRKPATPTPAEKSQHELTTSAVKIVDKTLQVEDKAATQEDAAIQFASYAKILAGSFNKSDSSFPQAEQAVTADDLKPACDAYNKAKINLEKKFAEAKAAILKRNIVKIDSRVKRGGVLPADFNLEQERIFVNQADKDLSFLRSNGNKWKMYLGPIVIEEKAWRELPENHHSKSTNLARLKLKIDNAKEYCRIKKERSLFKKADNYQKHLNDLMPFEESLKPKSTQADSKTELSLGNTLWTYVPGPIANLWPKGGCSQTGESEIKISQVRTAEIKAIEENEIPTEDLQDYQPKEAVSKNPSRFADVSTTEDPGSHSSSELQDPVTEYTILEDGQDPATKKSCDCSCSCLSSLAFWKKKPKEEPGTSYGPIGAPRKQQMG